MDNLYLDDFPMNSQTVFKTCRSHCRLAKLNLSEMVYAQLRKPNLT
jgi:hypothetical protein